MSKRQQTQNRERREEAKGKELAETKKENQQLRRQIARLTKQLSRITDISQSEDHEVSVKKEHKPKCPDCESTNIKTIKLHTGQLTACKDCGWRKKS